MLEPHFDDMPMAPCFSVVTEVLAAVPLSSLLP